MTKQLGEQQKVTGHAAAAQAAKDSLLATLAEKRLSPLELSILMVRWRAASLAAM
jgi:hypothetical protein